MFGGSLEIMECYPIPPIYTLVVTTDGVKQVFYAKETLFAYQMTN